MTRCSILVGAAVHTAVLFLASNASAQSRLVGTNQNFYLELDPTTGTATVLGGLSFRGIKGLAFDHTTNTLFCTDDRTDLLGTIDPATGAALTRGPMGFNNVNGLAFDPTPNARTLYGTADGQLLTINRASGGDIALGVLAAPVDRPAHACGVPDEPTTTMPPAPALPPVQSSRIIDLAICMDTTRSLSSLLNSASPKL